MNDSGDVVGIPRHFLLIDQGRNVFNLDVADVAEFETELEAQGIRVLNRIQLDVLEPVAGDHLLL